MALDKKKSSNNGSKKQKNEFGNIFVIFVLNKIKKTTLCLEEE